MWRLLATLCLLVPTVVRASAPLENEASHEYSYEYYEDEDQGKVNVSEHVKDYLTKMLQRKLKTKDTPVIKPDLKDKTNMKNQPERFIHFLGDHLRKKHAYHHRPGSNNSKVVSELSHNTSKSFNSRLNALETTSAKNQFMKNTTEKGTIGLEVMNDNSKGVGFNALSKPDMIGNEERKSLKDINTPKTQHDLLTKNTEVNTIPIHLFETPKTISDGLDISKKNNIKHRLVKDVFSSALDGTGATRDTSESSNNHFSAPVKLGKPVEKLYSTDFSKNPQSALLKNINISRVEDIKNRLKDIRIAKKPIKHTIIYPYKIYKHRKQIKRKNTAEYPTPIIHPFRKSKKFKDFSSNILSTINKPPSLQITNNLTQGLYMKELYPDTDFEESDQLKYQKELNDISNVKQIYEGVAEENVLKGNGYKNSHLTDGKFLSSENEANLQGLLPNCSTEYSRNFSDSLPNVYSYLNYSFDKNLLGDTTNYSMFSFIPKALVENYRENLKMIHKVLQPYSNTTKNNITHQQMPYNKLNSTFKTEKYLNKTQNDFKSKEKVHIPVNMSSDYNLKSVNISTTEDKYFKNKSDNITPQLTPVNEANENVSNNIVHMNLTSLVSFIMKDVKSVADGKYIYVPTNLTLLRDITDFDYSVPQELDILINRLTTVMVKSIYGKSIKKRKIRRRKRKGSSVNKLDEAKISIDQNKYESHESVVNETGLVEDKTKNNGDNSTLLIVDDVKILGDGNSTLTQSASATLNDTTNFNYSSPHPLEELIHHLAHVLSVNIKRRKVKKRKVKNTTENELTKNKKLNIAKNENFENYSKFEKNTFKEKDGPSLHLQENEGKNNSEKRVDSIHQERFEIINDKADKGENKMAERIEISGNKSNSSNEYIKENMNLSNNNTQHSILNAEDKLNKSQTINTLTKTELGTLKPNTVNGSLKTNRKSEVNDVHDYHTTQKPTDLVLNMSLADLENKTNLIEPAIASQNLSFTNDSYLAIQHAKEGDIESKEKPNLSNIDNKDFKIINNTYYISNKHKDEIDEIQPDTTNTIRLIINNNIARDLPIYITRNNTSIIINILSRAEITNNNNTITQNERNRTSRHEVENANDKPTKNCVLQEIENDSTKHIANQNCSYNSYLNNVIDNNKLITDSLSKIKRGETVLNSKNTQPGTNKKTTKVTKKTFTVESNIIETISENKK